MFPFKLHKSLDLVCYLSSFNFLKNGSGSSLGVFWPSKGEITIAVNLAILQLPSLTIFCFKKIAKIIFEVELIF